MQDRMKRHISNFKKTLEAKRSLDHELKVASHIQASMIPGSNRPFPDRKEFEIYSVTHPAQGVAGDFYDYYFIDDEHLFFIIGDVSGKGVPAALFMVKTITLLKHAAFTGDPLNLILSDLNDQLAADNEPSMFVTAICGILNITTGNLQICDAGHNTPLASFNQGDFEYFKLTKNLPFGIKEKVNYQPQDIKLNNRDIFFFYTDGVTEAMNRDSKLYSEEKLLEAIKDKSDQPLEEVARQVKISLDDFVQEAQQSDDITVLILRYTGKSNDIKETDTL